MRFRIKEPIIATRCKGGELVGVALGLRPRRPRHWAWMPRSCRSGSRPPGQKLIVSGGPGAVAGAAGAVVYDCALWVAGAARSGGFSYDVDVPAMHICPAEHLRQPLQRPRIPARRQVQHRIARDTAHCRPLDPGPVRYPPHPHLTQPRHDRTVMTALSPGPRHPVRPVTRGSRTSRSAWASSAQLNQPRSSSSCPVRQPWRPRAGGRQRSDRHRHTSEVTCQS